MEVSKEKYKEAAAACAAAVRVLQFVATADVSQLEIDEALDRLCLRLKKVAESCEALRCRPTRDDAIMSIAEMGDRWFTTSELREFMVQTRPDIRRGELTAHWVGKQINGLFQQNRLERKQVGEDREVYKYRAIKPTV